MTGKRLFALIVAAGLAGCGQPRPIDAHPALWRVADADTTIWLFGSIHALPPGVRWETPIVARAITVADTLILEIPPADASAARAQFLSVAERSGLPPLRERLPASDRGVLDRGMAAAGQSPGSLDGLKTWAAALTIAAGAGHAQDASGADGVEAVLTGRFTDKAIGALETPAGQFATFDRLPQASQRALLMQAAQDALDPARDYATLLKAWGSGNEAALAASVTPLRKDPTIERTLVTDRNARWASTIVRRMARPGRVFVAVGAGHLVGPGSVVAMLRARGLRVERVE